MQKQNVSQAEFDKRVEIEFCYLVYMDYMKKNEAWQKALDTINQKYTVTQ